MDTKTIFTPRLTLRPFTIEDSQNMFDNWAKSEAVCRYLTWEPHKNVTETEEIVQLWVDAYNKPKFYQWAVERTDDGALIGSISLQENDYNSNCVGWMPGYCFGEKFWGQGYATETLDAVTNYFFNTVQEDNILFCVHETENTASGNTMQKVGFQHLVDGTFPRINGVIVPARFYALKKEDYNG